MLDIELEHGERRGGKLLACLGEQRVLVLVGHNPGLQELVFRLVDPEHEDALFAAASEKFPTAALAVLEVDIDDWRDISAGCGKLTHFARPRDLDPALGPEHSR